MTFEFDYDTATDQITIVYDSAFVLTVEFDGEKPKFKNFDKIDDEDIENMLRNLCRNAYSVLA